MATNKTNELKSNILDLASTFSELANFYKSDIEYSLFSENSPSAALVVFCHGCRYALKRSGDFQKDRRYIKVIKSLIRLGADPNCDWEGRASLPLFNESEKGNLAAVKILLKHAAKVDGLDSTNNPFKVTPLMIAARERHMSVLAYLLKAGAKINRRDINGMYAIDYAKHHGHSGIINLLIKAAAA